MKKLCFIIIAFGTTSLVQAQIYADTYTAYTDGGSLSEFRTALFLNSTKAVSFSGNFFSDGVSYETFPRLGILFLLRNKEGNYNIATYGLQVTGIGAQRDLSLVYNMDFLRVSPFINLRTPLFQLKRDCKCGKPSGLLLELVADLNLTYPSLGFGIRKGFN